MDIIGYLDDVFGGARLIPEDPVLWTATMSRVEQAKELHLSIRYVTFHWGLGRLAMLNSKERSQLAELAQQGNDGENLVAFTMATATGRSRNPSTANTSSNFTLHFGT